MADWTTDAVDTLEQIVDTVRDKTVVPAQNVRPGPWSSGCSSDSSCSSRSRCSASQSSAWLVIITGDVWLAYLILGGIFVIAGAFVWTLRIHSPRRTRIAMKLANSSSSVPARPG